MGESIFNLLVNKKTFNKINRNKKEEQMLLFF